MLIIRNAQIEQMALPSLRRVRNAAAVALAQHYPEAHNRAHEVGLERYLGALLEDARRLGLKEERNVIAYLVLCVRFDTNSRLLQKRPSVAAILGNQALNETEKVYLLEEALAQP